MATQTEPSQATQDGQAGRALRSGYRALHAQAIRDGEDLVSLEKSKLADMLAQANALQEKVQRPREQAVDSEVFAHLTDRGVELAKKLAHGGRGHNAKDFLRRLKAQYVQSSQAQEDGALQPDAFNWVQMGSDVAYMFRPVPGVFCMVGPLDAQPKVRKAVVRQKRQELGELVRPDHIEGVEEQEKQETDKNLDEIWKVLGCHNSVPLLELVMNHRSFAQTVENLFGVSFLVRDGKVSLTKSEKGAMITKIANRSDEAANDDKDTRVQFIISLTIADWEEWKKYVDPADCLMKHRQPRDHSTPATAAGGAAAATPEDQAGPSRRGNGSGAGPSRGGGVGSSGRRKQGRRQQQPSSDDEESDASEQEAPPARGKRGRRS